MLVQHFALRAGARPLPLAELDALTVHLLALTPEVRTAVRLNPASKGTLYFASLHSTCISPCP